MPSIVTDSIDSGIYLGLNPIIDLNIRMDTQKRISKLDLFNIVQNPASDKLYNTSLIDYSNQDSFPFLKSKEDDGSIESLIKNPKNKLSDLLQSKDPDIRMKANEYYDNVVQPKINKDFAKNNGMFAPYQKGQEKYLEDNWWSESSKTKYGFNPTLSLKENDDIYHTNVWNNYSSGGKLWRGTLTTAGRIGEGILSGAGKTISYIGTGLYYGVQDIFEDESKGDTNFIASVADNAMARALEDMDEKFKEQVLPVWKSINYDNKGFFSKLGDASFYQSEGADMAAFALGAMIPGIGFGKLGNVLKGLNTAGKLGKFGFLGADATGFAGKALQFATGAKNVGGVTGWAFNTANEAFMEASGVHKSVKERLSRERQQGLNGMTDGDIEQAAADAAAKDFKYNFAILAASNAFENKLFGKYLKGREDVGDFISVNKATGTASKAVTNWKKFSSYLDPVNYLEKIPIIGKSFAPLSRVGFYSRLAFGLPGMKALAMEGLWEENAQLAAQRISEDKYYTSIIEGGGELTKETKSFFPQLFQQTVDAYKGNDVEAGTSIGSGMLLGSTMNVGIAKTSGERKDILNKIDGYTDKTTKEKIKGSIERINDARDSMFSYTDVYETEKKGDVVTLKLGEDGKPIVNAEKAKATLDKIATVNKHIDIADQTAVKQLRDLHFREAFSLYMHEIFKVDGQNAVIESIEDISKKGKDDFNLFNVQFGDLKNSPAKYIDFAKQLKTIYDTANKLEFVNSNNHDDKDKFEYEKAQARSLFYSLSSSKLTNEGLLDDFMDEHKAEFKNEANQLVYDKNDKSIAFSLFSLLTDLNLNALKIAHLETNEEDYTKQDRDVKSKIKELKAKNKEIVDRYSSIYDIKEQENGYYTESSDNELVSEHLTYAAHMSNNISFLNDDILSFSNQKTGLTSLSKYIKAKTETIASNIEEARKAEEAIIAESVSSKQKEDKDKEDIALGFSYKIGEKEYNTISSIEEALKNNIISFKQYEDALDAYNKILPEAKTKTPAVEETDLDKLLNKHVIGSLTIPNYLNDLMLDNEAEFNIIKDNEELFLELLKKNKRLETNQVKAFNSINTLLYRAEEDKAVIVEENGGSFYNIAGKLYQRVSNFIGNIFNKDTVSSLENGENAVTVGNYVDLVSRILLENTDYTFEDISFIIDEEKKKQIDNVNSPIELLKAKRNYRHFDLHNVELFEQVKGQIIDIKKAILEKHPGAVIVSKEVLIKRDGDKEGQMGVAGTTDVLVIDKAGIVHIYDFKTKKASISDNVLTKLSTKYNDKSDLDKYTNQQSAYKQLLENEGLKTGDINLIVFPVTYAPIVFKGDMKNELDLLNYSPVPTLVKLTQDFVLIPLTYKEDVNLLPNKNEEIVEDVAEDTPPATETGAAETTKEETTTTTNDNNDIEGQVGNSNYSIINGLIFYNNSDGTVRPISNPDTNNTTKEHLLKVIEADIERRRQEELKKLFGTHVELISSRRIPVITRLVLSFPSGATFMPNEIEAQGLIDDLDKINAKYDAELAALEGGENPSVNDNSSSNDGGNQQEGSSTRAEDEESNAGKGEEDDDIVIGDKNDLEKEQLLNGRKAFKTENKTVTRETQEDDKRRDLMTADGNAILLKDDPYEYEANRFLREMLDKNPEKYTLFIVKDTEEWVNQRIPEEGRQKALDNLGYVIIVKNKKGEILRFNGKTFTANKKGAPLLFSIDRNVFKDKDGGRKERAVIYVDYMDRISRGASTLTVEQVIEGYEREEKEKEAVFAMLEKDNTLEFPISIDSISKGIFPKGVSKPVHERFGDDFELQVIINPKDENGLKKGSVFFKPKDAEEWLPLHTRKLTYDESVELRDLLKYEYDLTSEKGKTDIENVEAYIKSLVYLSKKKYLIFKKLLPNGSTVLSIKQKNQDPNIEDSKINPLDLSDEVLMNVVNTTSNSIVNTNQKISTFSVKDGELIEKEMLFKDFLKGKIFTNTLSLQYKGEKVFHRIQSYISFNIDETLLESETVENKEEKTVAEEDEKKPVITKKKDRKKTSSLKNNKVNKISEIKEDKDCTKK